MDNIAAEAAENILNFWDRPQMLSRAQFLRELKVFVLAALSQSLVARDKEIEELMNACHTLRMTYANNSLRSNDMNRFLKDIGFTAAHDALLKGKAI